MEERSVSFKVGEEVLKGTMFIPDNSEASPGVVFYHGRGSSRRRYLPMAQELAQAGCLTLAFDFRGCGESDGDFSKQSHQKGVEDAAAALDFLIKSGALREKIGLCGSSFGGYTACMILPRFPFVKSLILRSPAAYSDHFLLTPNNELRTKEFFARQENWTSSSAFYNLRQFKGELLVLKCEKDELLPDILIERYYQIAENANERKLDILQGADHQLSNPFVFEEFYKKTVRWFLKTLGGR